MTMPPGLSSFTGADMRRAAAAVAGVADVVLRLDRAGTILDGAFGPGEGLAAGAELVGRPMASIVDAKDRGDLKTLLTSVAGGEGPCTARLRHVPPVSVSAPVRYSALAGKGGAVLLFGRCEPKVSEVDPTALLDDAGSRRSRAAQARYEALFETAAEAVMVVSPWTGIVEDANPRALALIGRTLDEVAGQPLAAVLPDVDPADLDTRLSRARETGAFSPLTAAVGRSGRRVLLAGRVFRGLDGMQMILHLSVPAGAGGGAHTPQGSMLSRLLRESGDALALTDRGGRIAWANDAFTSIVAPDTDTDAVGRTLGELTGYSGPVLQGILSDACERRRITLFDCALRGAGGRFVEGRLTVIALDRGDGAFGVCFRTAAARAEVPADPMALPLLRGEDGASMKDLLRDATEEIERSCIEGALKLTGGNKALAAKALGLSRQSLYVKLRHFGLM